MKSKLMLILLSLLFLVSCSERPAYRNPELSTEDRVEDLLKRMTLDEKIDQLAGLPDNRGMKTATNERLGIPDFKMSDGPIGVRWDTATAFPSGVSLAATWDTSLASEYGKALAKETLFKGRNYILGPCINLHRLPTGGRNFESFGEDPWLAGRMAVAYIKAVQNEGVISAVKHYALNNQEWERFRVNVKVDEQTLMELYLPHFEMAVKEGGVYTVMAAYNKVNGWYASENQHLLNDILKNDWGFKGLVVSDWGATHSTVNAIKNGLDIEMPTAVHFSHEKIKLAIQDGSISENDIDNMVRRILWVKFKSGLFDRPTDMNFPNPFSKSRQVAYDVAARSMVLLKNERSILPLNVQELRSIAIIGPNAAVARTGGGGSSRITPASSPSPLDVFSEMLGKKLIIGYAEGVKLQPSQLHPIPARYFRTPDGKPGLKAEYFQSLKLEGQPKLTRVDSMINFNWEDRQPAKELGNDQYSVRWTGILVPPVTRKYALVTASDDGVRLTINGKTVIDNWTDHATAIDSAYIELKAGVEYPIILEFYENGGSAVCQLGWDYFEGKNDYSQTIAEAATLAKKSDVAIVFVGASDFIESEGFDRVGGMGLSIGQDELIAEVVKANPKTIVVLYGGTAIDMKDWGSKVPAIIDVFFPGQEGSTALFDIITGKVNPSGKLPFSFISCAEQSPAYKNYRDATLVAPYHEGVFMGYRYYEKHNIKPAFPFGHGLSFTTFEYDSLKVNRLGKDSCEVVVKVSNTGNREGAEVVQLYVAPPVGSNRPPKELKGFAIAHLKPGEETKVKMVINSRSFARWDSSTVDWTIDKGLYTLKVGSSSEDIRLEAPFEIN